MHMQVTQVELNYKFKSELVNPRDNLWVLYNKSQEIFDFKNKKFIPQQDLDDINPCDYLRSTRFDVKQLEDIVKLAEESIHGTT